MKTLVLHKVVVLAAALALGGACLANDALAKGGANDALAKGGGGHGGGGDHGDGVHHFVGSVRDHGSHGRRMGGDFSRQPVWR